MKAVILAGGLGSRLSEETTLRPKPLVEIGGLPIIWHIMKIYSQNGINDFVVCLGYKGYMIKEYFANYFLHTSDVTIDVANNQLEIHRRHAEPWNITLIDTGMSSMTGGRLGRVAEYVKDDDCFALTYGDGVGDMDIRGAVEFHKQHGSEATITAVRPAKRFGALALDGTRVDRFKEKPDDDGGWINGGFFVLNPSVLSLIEDDATIWEKGPLETLAARGQLQAFLHHGFWSPMDTIRDKAELEELWADGRAPWKTW